MRWLSVPRLLRLLTPKTAPQHADPEFAAKVARYTDALQRRGAWIYRPNCLRRSLVLYRLLRRAGINVQICLGVRRADATAAQDISGGLEGHAWLVYQDMPFLERQQALPQSYRTTYRFPAQEE
jgi:hypothetical protein